MGDRFGNFTNENDLEQRSDFAAEKANGVKLGFPRVRSQGFVLSANKLRRPGFGFLSTF